MWQRRTASCTSTMAQKSTRDGRRVGRAKTSSPSCWETEQAVVATTTSLAAPASEVALVRGQRARNGNPRAWQTDTCGTPPAWSVVQSRTVMQTSLVALHCHQLSGRLMKQLPSRRMEAAPVFLPSAAALGTGLAGTSRPGLLASGTSDCSQARVHEATCRHPNRCESCKLQPPAGLRCRRRSQLRPTAARRPWEAGTVNGFKFTEPSVAVRPSRCDVVCDQAESGDGAHSSLTPGCSVSAVPGAIGQQYVHTYLDSAAPHLQLPVFSFSCFAANTKPVRLTMQLNDARLHSLSIPLAHPIHSHH